MTKTITKILIANRGEIACRVIRTARKMGIATVAVYSDADRKALHVKLADEAVHIGPSPAAESYLVIDKLIDAAKQTGADAVHPGYGFLSENPDFVRACEKAGLIFIGPKAESMEAMGLKDAAKKLMDKAGVPTTPGYHGKDQTPSLLKAKAGMIGYPVLIKAVAGGGGKGMRKVEAEKDFEAALASCQREAKSSFGNDDVLIEKYIQSPRHIEVQVFGDTHGNVVHMFERDCSLQRRHQKVIEEAPAPGMTDEVREAMTSAAIDAAKAVDYVGAGTVEFIVDGSGKLRRDGFWFMEMNTRLQVEHPVTEMITGLDLVEWQIRVARGEKLPAQDDIRIDGHAIEARLYAEDPENDFLPSIGKILHFNAENSTFHDEDEAARIDTGVQAGDSVTINYDPMIAKLIAFAVDRPEAIETLSWLIASSQVAGITTNSGFLYRALRHSDFKAGRVSTHFINDNIDVLKSTKLKNSLSLYALAALFLAKDEYEHPNSPFGSSDGWRLNLPISKQYIFQNGENSVHVILGEQKNNFTDVNVNGKNVLISSDLDNSDLDNEDVLNRYLSWTYKRLADHISITRKGDVFKVYFPSYDFDAVASADSLTASMPGKIISVNVKAGDTVKAGDPLIVMEAMKMEMTLEAPRDGVVEAVNHAAGELVSDGDVLLSLETED